MFSLTGSSEPLPILDPATPPPCLVTEEVAAGYYKGLPSRPRLVATTRPGPFETPAGPEAYTVPKELRVLGNHPLANIWEDDLAFKLHHVLNSMDVNWTSTDVVRIANAEDSSGAVVIWIGVEPGTLSFDDGAVVVLKCREVLDTYRIQGVDIEIRESRIIRPAGRRFLSPALGRLLAPDPTLTHRESFTATLGIPISTKKMPHIEGTGGFYISAGGDDKKIYLVTARHIVLPKNKDTNVEWRRKNTSEPRYDVVVLGNSGFSEKLSAISDEIEIQQDGIKHIQNRIDFVAGRNDQEAERVRNDAEDALRNVNQTIEDLIELRQNIMRWTNPNDRVFGHLVWSPPIKLSEDSGQYTQDFAVIEIHPKKLDAQNYRGNAIDLGLKYTGKQLDAMMYPKKTNKSDTSFEYPPDRLMRLRGLLPERELYKLLPVVDANDDPCLMVIKNGAKTGLTVGRGNNVCSYSRCYFEGACMVSKEWPIINYDRNSGIFSESGDSGAVIADAFGRICGLITASTGPTDSTDITFATPVDFIMKVLRTTETFKHAHLNPVLPA